MTELVRSWVMGITGVSLITGLVMSLTPKGRVRRIASLVCGIAMIATLISPVLSFEYDTYSQLLMDYNYNMDSYTENMEEENERLTRLIIQEDVSAYILDKAESLGLENVTVSVNTELDADGSWYPYEMWIEGDYSEAEMKELGNYIEAEFGIPAGRQYWSGINE